MTGQAVAVARRAFLESIRSRVARDPRMQALWLVGSLGRDERVDEWSDIDVVCVFDDSELESWVVHRESELCAFGQLLFPWDAPQNAFQPGYMLCSMFDAGPAPMWVDWHVQPASTARRPADSLALWEKVPMAVSAETFSESLAGVWSDESQPSLRHLADDDEWRGEVGMAYQALKQLSRRAAANAVRHGVPAAEDVGAGVIAEVEAVFARHAEHLPDRLVELLAESVKRVGRG